MTELIPLNQFVASMHTKKWRFRDWNWLDSIQASNLNLINFPYQFELLNQIHFLTLFELSHWMLFISQFPSCWFINFQLSLHWFVQAYEMGHHWKTMFQLKLLDSLNPKIIEKMPVSWPLYFHSKDQNWHTHIILASIVMMYTNVILKSSRTNGISRMACSGKKSSWKEISEAKSLSQWMNTTKR